MAISLPGGTGNYLKLDTALGTDDASVFIKFRVPSVPGAAQVPLAIATRGDSTPYGLGEQVHCFRIIPDGANFAIDELAYWDSPNGAIVSGIAPGTIVCLSISMYEASGRPAIKYGVKPAGGTFASRTRNEVWWTSGNNVYTWANATIWLGANHGGASGAQGLALDCVMYGSAVTDDGDIEQQMDAISAEFSTPYWVTSMRGYASVALAAAKESGSASPSAWTINGSVTVDNGFDGGSAEEVPQLSGGGVLGIADSLSAPATPAGFATTTVTGTSITLTWSPSSGATWYYIYGRKVATEVDYELYQSTSDAPPLVIANLEPRVEYGFVIVATNAAGDSAPSSEVTATTANLRLRLRATPNAAGKDGITVSVHYPPVPGRLVGEHIRTFSDQEWESGTVTDPELGETVAEMFIEIEPGDTAFSGGFSDGDTLEAYAESDDQTEASWVMKDVKVQVA